MSEPLDTFLRLRPRMQNAREDSGWIFGDIEITETDTRLSPDLEMLRESGVISEIHQGGELVFPGGLARGPASLKIDTGLLQGYFETYDSLVSKHPVEPPDSFTVLQNDPSLLDGCRAAWALLQFLRNKVEVWDETQMRFYFVDQAAIEIPLCYQAESSRKIILLLPRIERFLHNDHLDADTRWAFFRKQAVRLLRDVATENRLSFFFSSIPQVFESTEQDYSLYLERFSFEDLLRTFDEKRLKFVGDLNQVLAGVQTALIAVPVAFFLIAEKFKPANGIVGQNAVLSIGGIVFCALLMVLSFNQGGTLEEIRKALSDFESEQLQRQTERSGRLRALLKGTWAHYRRVRLLLWIVRLLLFAFALVMALALAWCSLSEMQKRWPYEPPATVQTSSPAQAVTPPNPNIGS
jgi:hypothetical protein